jgi:hypothetical protein
MLFIHSVVLPVNAAAGVNTVSADWRQQLHFADWVDADFNGHWLRSQVRAFFTNGSLLAPLGQLFFVSCMGSNQNTGDDSDPVHPNGRWWRRVSVK